MGRRERRASPHRQNERAMAARRQAKTPLLAGLKRFPEVFLNDSPSSAGLAANTTEIYIPDHQTVLYKMQQSARLREEVLRNCDGTKFGHF